MALVFDENSAPPADLDSVRNLQETADFFEVTAPTLRSWIREGCPVEESGANGVAYKMDLRKVKAWRDDQRAADIQARAEKAAADKQLAIELFGDDLITPAGGEAMSPRQMRELAVAQKELMLLEMQRGALVNAEDLAILLSGLFRRMADRLRLLPDQLERSHGLGADQAAEISDAIDDALNDLADELDHDAGLSLEAEDTADLLEAAE